MSILGENEHLGGSVESEPRLLRPRGVGSESAARPARVGTMISASRAALGAGGRNGTDR